MLRRCLVLILLCLASEYGFACYCYTSPFRACDALHNDAVFTGTVIETVREEYELYKGKFRAGYAMRFAVSEALHGALGTEVIVHTGAGGGDCGTPLAPGARFLIFAHKNPKGNLETGLCSGNQPLTVSVEQMLMLEQLRAAAKKGSGSIYGSISLDPGRGSATPVANMVVNAHSEKFTASVQTGKDGSFEFAGLPNGKYTVSPEIPKSLDYDHRYDTLYQPEVFDGGCAGVTFQLQPSTRIRGHVKLPAGVHDKQLEVAAFPVRLHKPTQEATRTELTDANGQFDLWPLPAGDYFVRVNINSSPSEDMLIPPTYYPGVSTQKAAGIVHVAEGEAKELEMSITETSVPRKVFFEAIGLDGKPMRALSIDLEDLQHPGEAPGQMDVFMDDGSGILIVSAGHAYHLHAHRGTNNGTETDWCSKPVTITAGTASVRVRFVMDHEAATCDIAAIDAAAK
jgi:hypothetical protein